MLKKKHTKFHESKGMVPIPEVHWAAGPDSQPLGVGDLATRVDTDKSKTGQVQGLCKLCE